MITIGGKPILWHIMKTYQHFGFDKFLVATGYKAEVIEDYLTNACPDLDGLSAIPINTGLDTATGGRIKRCFGALENETFFATYGDGVGNIDIGALLSFHKSHGKLVTLTAVRPPARFGRIELDGNQVTHFGEKMQSQEGWINGGFFVIEPNAVDYISGDEMAFEHDPLVRLANEGQLQAFRHEGFWQPMDTLRERVELENLWERNTAPWKVWN